MFGHLVKKGDEWEVRLGMARGCCRAYIPILKKVRKVMEWTFKGNRVVGSSWFEWGRDGTGWDGMIGDDWERGLLCGVGVSTSERD